MIKVSNIETWGFQHALRGMRNPLNSWDKGDSIFCDKEGCLHCDEYAKECSSLWKYVDLDFSIGKKDLNLMKKLYKAGSEHRKYLRQIMVSMDIIAPLYWWKEFDTYKVGTVTNSCSTMHTLHTKRFEIEDFSHEHLFLYEEGLTKVITILNYYRDRYLETKDKRYWWQIIQLLPASYNQKRTVTMNYENVITIINQRKHHKLDEWIDLVSYLYELPYVEDLYEEL